MPLTKPQNPLIIDTPKQDLFNMSRRIMLFILLCSSATSKSQQANSILQKEALSVTPLCTQIYKDLHAHPELATNETETSSRMKKEMAALGLEIIDSLGYKSFAAILRNGAGPTVLYRTDMDGLPVEEKTGLPFASTSKVKKGEELLPAMHACGHDIHMASWYGTASVLLKNKKNWSGTVIFLAQSAEETGQGAKKIISSAGFSSLPKPDYQLAIHSQAYLPSGVAGFCDGFSMAAVDMMTITIYGKGGHGAAPEKCIDPIVISAQFINSIQTIVSRNLSSSDPAVITVGSIQGGTVHNVIPDLVTLKLTIRSYSKESRKIILDRIKSIGDNLALAAGLKEDRLPKYDLLDMSIPPVYNDPLLGARLRGYIQKEMGAGFVQTVKPVMIGEDFGVYGTDSGIPSYLIWIGTVSSDRLISAQNGKTELKSLHSSEFAPDFENTIPAAVRIMTGCITGLLSAKK